MKIQHFSLAKGAIVFSYITRRRS